jgi:hypothetical protein
MVWSLRFAHLFSLAFFFASHVADIAIEQFNAFQIIATEKNKNSLTLFSRFMVVWWLTVFARIPTFRQVHKVQPRVAKGRAARARPLVHHAKLPDQRRNGMLAAARVGHREGAILRHSDGPPLEDCCYVSFVRGTKKTSHFCVWSRASCS